MTAPRAGTPEIALPPASPRDADAVRAAMAAGNPDAGLACGLPALAARPSLDLLLALAECSVRAGAAGIGLWIVRSMRVAGSDRPLADIAAGLARAPSGEIPRAILEARWRERRGALLAREPRSLVGLSERLPDDLSVFVTRRGNALFLRGVPGRGSVVPLAPFEDAVGAVERAALPDAEPGMAIAFLGAPSEALLRRALELRTWLGYRPPVDVVEPDAALATAWIASLADGSALDGPLTVFAGEGAQRRYADALAEHRWRLAPTVRATVRRAGHATVALEAGFDERVGRERLDRERAEVEAIAARDRTRGSAWWRGRLAGDGSGGPLRFVGFTARHSTFVRQSMERLAAAFRRKGCEFDVVAEPNDWAARADVLGALGGRPYDAVFLVNHLRSEYGEVLRDGPPCVSWIQDYMPSVFTRAAGASIGARDLVLCHEPDEMEALYGFPGARMLATTNLGDPDGYAPEPLPAEELDACRCDVAFASHASESPEELVAIATAGDLAPLRPLLSLALRAIELRLSREGAIAPHALVELMLAAERDSGSGPFTPAFRRAHLFPEITRLYDRVLRHESARWTARWAADRGRAFRLHGKGWERHPELARFARGPIAPGRPLRALYQASAVTLQVSGHMSLHQRLVDALLAGGCVVSRFNPNDFRRASAAILADALRERGIESMRELDAARRADPALDAACAGCERDFGLAIRPKGHPVRDAQIAATRAGNDLPGLCDDDAFVATLRAMRYVPRRSACDLPGFASTAFASETELRALLDRLVDDPAERRRISAPMRASVAANDTCDALADRVLAALRRMAEALP